MLLLYLTKNRFENDGEWLRSVETVASHFFVMKPLRLLFSRQLVMPPIMLEWRCEIQCEQAAKMETAETALLY